MGPKLSVCVTAYNRAEGLDRTLRSLAAQSRLPDDLTPIAERYRASFPALRIHRNARNL